MDKMRVEIVVSTGLVLLMIILLVGVELVAPDGIKSIGSVLVLLLFMLLMGGAGIKLMDMA
jgi:hypothetical protein